MSFRFVGAAAVLLGCVGGNDTSDAATIGSLGGPCFANNTCNAGLTCVLLNGKGVCQESDAGSGGDVTVDQTVSDTSTSDAPSDASDANDACTQTLAPGRSCAQGCPQSGGWVGCCEQTGQCVATAAACTQALPWACQAMSDCTNGATPVCCVQMQLSPTCPPSGQVSTTVAAQCQQMCVNEARLCLGPNDCPSNAPTCVGVNVSGVQSAIGVCM
jgi:hypothetical protein